MLEERNRDEDILRAYASTVFAQRFSASVDVDWEEFEFDTTAVTPTGVFQDRIQTTRIRPELRYFNPTGFFASIRATRYDQEVDQFDTLDATARTTVESEFWVTDATLGYRFPKRWGSFVLEGRNLSNRKFEFYERTILETVIPARTILARLEITY